MGRVAWDEGQENWECEATAESNLLANREGGKSAGQEKAVNGERRIGISE